MTYTPVSNMNSMVMDFKTMVPDLTPVSKDSGFTDVFKGQTQSMTDDLQKTTSAKDISQTADEAMQQQSKPVKEIKQTQDTSNDSEPLNEEDEKALTDEVKETLEEVVEDLADKLDVDEEDILKAMETLGVTLTDLLLPENLSNVVLEVSGETDPMALVTDENLTNLVKDINQTIKSALDDIAAAYDVTSEEAAAISKENDLNFDDSVKEALKGGEEIGEALLNGDEASQNEPKVTFDIRREAENVSDRKEAYDTTSQTDDAVNAGSAAKETFVNAVSKNNSNSNKDLHQDADSRDSGNLLLQNIAQKVTETVQETTNEAVSYTEVRQVMDQVVESIHISVKPETSDIEMMLHPEELGTVNVHLSSKEGVVTAQFTTQNEAVKGVLESQMIQLKETFEAQGVKVDNIEVQVQTNAFTQEYENSRDHDNSEEDGSHRRGTRRINLAALDSSEEELNEEDNLTVSMMEANGTTVDYLA